MPLECDVGDRCKNSIQNIGERREKCSVCRFAPDSVVYERHYWLPVDRHKDRHPQLQEEKRKARYEYNQKRTAARRKKDAGKTSVLRRAAAAEKKTEREIIKATKNSGRSLKDGDHVAFDVVTLDTKNQSTRSHPLVRLDELDKVRRDAKRARCFFGGLVIRNRHGRGVVVVDEEDFAKMMSILKLQKKECEKSE